MSTLGRVEIVLFLFPLYRTYINLTKLISPPLKQPLKISNWPLWLVLTTLGQRIHQGGFGQLKSLVKTEGGFDCPTLVMAGIKSMAYTWHCMDTSYANMVHVPITYLSPYITGPRGTMVVNDWCIRMPGHYLYKQIFFSNLYYTVLLLQAVLEEPFRRANHATSRAWFIWDKKRPEEPNLVLIQCPCRRRNAIRFWWLGLWPRWQVPSSFKLIDSDLQIRVHIKVFIFFSAKTQVLGTQKIVSLRWLIWTTKPYAC